MKVLITGAFGQIGSELTMVLRNRYGNQNVIASDIKYEGSDHLKNSGPFFKLDCTDYDQLKKVVKQHKIDTIYHLASILSGVAELNPQKAWHVNINGLYNVLEIARESKSAVFTPSSIGVFGPSTPLEKTPQDTIQRPTSMYGVTKVTGELICEYYFKKFDVDTRGLRYPGIISNETLPGGGTTDYAVEIFYEAIKKQKYICFLKATTFLDMMYMPDAIHGAIKLMETNPENLLHRNAFNVTAMSFAPENLFEEIKKHLPEFHMDYKIDPVRQAIADSWPRSMDDSAARQEWGWEPQYNLPEMTSDMISVLSKKLKFND
jgi:nucleoside-diphosphate-sugar epimerase